MCGIAGFIKNAKANEADLVEKASIFQRELRHRGPDRQGFYIDPKEHFVVAHTRLAVLDLSAHGDQPMKSEDERHILVFNGEIYNHQELRRDLEQKGIRFTGHSDTETLFKCLITYGFDKTLTMLNGMFAFAFIDRQKDKIHFARDRFGKKPLYMGFGSDGFYFSSELKAIRIMQPSLKINQDVLSLYLRWRYVPDPYCIYEGFWKLPPSSALSLSLSKLSDCFDLLEHINEYYSVKELIVQPKDDISDERAVSEGKSILTQAVKSRLISDVPLGVFLSGGIDSSLIAAIAKEQAGKKIHSLTIALEDPSYNEAEYAKEIADHLGLEHTEISFNASDALESVSKIAGYFDEPFADPSSIPSFHICRLAKSKITVALSGDGGDESFGGYSWYSRANKLKTLFMLPYPMRIFIATILGSLPIRSGRFSSSQIKKICSIIGARSASEIYPYLLSYWDSATKGARQTELKTPYDTLLSPNDPVDPIQRLMGYDMKMFLAGDVLTKVDRTSMASGLEVRSPLLDQRVVEFAWSLPLDKKIRANKGKWLLREILKEFVPQSLFDRPKKGFSIPHGKWLKHEIRPYAQELFSKDNLEKRNLVDPELVRPYWQAHIDGKQDNSHYLWTLLMLYSWFEHQEGL